jgi:hypothetical protein
MHNSFPFAVSFLIAGLVSTGAFAESGIEPPMDLLATQLRDQGFPCDHPSNAKLDEKASRPSERVWVVECKGVRYRMTVVPDLAAKIEKLGK